ncbi:MarR family winged helix-turn-helix transcriptional regulator [Streptococcus moroccensis]|uniref:DNA-binding MarR family transcriptional regulator n=1 Tax=Streptococcus moroccensis TaxID=1451356 RepID=A0ABT9YRV4_9STRE|nr:MarR family transcriptional regulator [Streptococcus moroccensis]MDQ0222048.1 DNA-binding MarR family transcriptional regulator [Streptococcus moroccensis]
MDNPLSDMRAILTQLESICEELAIKKDVQHLSGPQGRVLIYLSHHKEEAIFVKDIEQELKISKSVASNLVKRMVKNDFITIIPSEVDKRCKQVVLTTKGTAKIQLLKEFHEEVVEQLFQGISWDDMKLVHQVVKRLQENITNYTGGEHA